VPEQEAREVGAYETARPVSALARRALNGSDGGDLSAEEIADELAELIQLASTIVHELAR